MLVDEKVVSTKQIVRSFIAENLLYSADGSLGISDDDSFIEHAVIDSTGILELTLFVEETFQVRVPDDEVVPENFDSINKLTSYILRKREGAM